MLPTYPCTLYSTKGHRGKGWRLSRKRKRRNRIKAKSIAKFRQDINLSLFDLPIYLTTIFVHDLKWIKTNFLYYCWMLLGTMTLMMLAVTPMYFKCSDSTLGYPGEGWGSGREQKRRNSKWSNKFDNLSMVTWNTRSMTVERFAYYNSLGYGILAVTELWRNQEKFTSRSDEFIVSAAKHKRQAW